MRIEIEYNEYRLEEAIKNLVLNGLYSKIDDDVDEEDSFEFEL